MPSPPDQGDRLEAFVHGLGGDESAVDARQTLTLHAARALRAAILRDVQQPQIDDAQAEEALIAAWQRQGLLRGAASSPPMGSRLSRWLVLIFDGQKKAPWVAGATVFATIAAVLVFLPHQADRSAHQQPAEVDAGTMRGAEQAVRLQVADPAALVSKLERLFVERRVRFRVVAGESGAISVQAQLAGHGADLTSDLVQLGVPIPPTGRLNLLISGLESAGSR